MDLFYLTTLRQRIEEDQRAIARACAVAKKRIMPLLLRHGIADAEFDVAWDKMAGAVLTITYYRGNGVTGRDGMITLKIPQVSLYDDDYIEEEVVRRAS